LKELYKNIGILYKKGRLMEIPVFQTKDQFQSIINKTEAPDAVILDLESEAGRNDVARKYDPLVHKIAKDFYGKSNLDYEDLLSAGRRGLVYAMNGYGKKTKRNAADLETIVSKTFTQYAAFMIRISILEDIKDVSQTVRVPISQQNKERQETGRNTKSNTVSGDKEVGSSGDEGNKSLFDFMGGTDNATRDIDEEDLQKLWDALYKKLEEKFDKTTLEIWYSSFGINGREKMKKKELAQKYGIVPSNVSYYLYKVNSYINSDKKILGMMEDIRDLMAECKHDKDMEYDPEEGLHIKIEDAKED
jgi:RNA polymerase sigma factor (sigma-70 family)